MYYSDDKIGFVISDSTGCNIRENISPRPHNSLVGTGHMKEKGMKNVYT